MTPEQEALKRWQHEGQYMELCVVATALGEHDWPKSMRKKDWAVLDKAKVVIQSAANDLYLLRQYWREQGGSQSALLEVCEIALDALGCDRTRQDRLRAQEIIHDLSLRGKEKG